MEYSVGRWKQRQTFIHNLNTWDKIICLISQREMLFEKNARNKSCRYPKVPQFLSMRVFYTINQLITRCQNRCEESKFLKTESSQRNDVGEQSYRQSSYTHFLFRTFFDTLNPLIARWANRCKNWVFPIFQLLFHLNKCMKLRLFISLVILVNS